MGLPCIIIMGKDVMALAPLLQHNPSHDLCLYFTPMQTGPGDYGNHTDMQPYPGLSIQSLSRCRGTLEAIFLLDNTTADRHYLEHSAIHYTDRATKRSSFKFPQEQQIAKDWKLWGQFWLDYTGQGYKLKVPLGKWIQPTHQQWQQFYDVQKLGLNKSNNLEHLRLQANQETTILLVSSNVHTQYSIGKHLCKQKRSSHLGHRNCKGHCTKTARRPSTCSPKGHKPWHLGILVFMGRDVDVVQYLEGPTNTLKPGMASKRS
jgi:hypothetical protein